MKWSGEQCRLTYQLGDVSPEQEFGFEKPMRFVTERLDRLAAYCLSVSMLCLLSITGHAACFVSSGFGAQDVRMELGRVLIQPDLPVGAIIQTLQVPITAKTMPGLVTSGAFPEASWCAILPLSPGFRMSIKRMCQVWGSGFTGKPVISRPTTLTR